MKLADISRFDKISDYLPILNAVLFTDLFFMGVLYYTPLLKSKNLARWYETYRLSGMLCDITIIMIGFVIARAIYYKIFKEFTPEVHCSSRSNPGNPRPLVCWCLLYS